MHTFDNGWYRISGSTVTTHYFFNDTPLHILKHGGFQIDYSKRYANNYKHCLRCEQIIHAYRFIGLDNRLK